MNLPLLFVAVFISGMSTLGVEMTASRLLGTVFGTSNLVWANIIGMFLLYLTAGYFIGGRWADRSPYPEVFYRILCWAAFTNGLVPVVAHPVLRNAAAAVEKLDIAVMAGSFLSMLVLFVVPITLMGCISPFAIRLAITDPSRAGRISGRIYAISTMGSILGTFLPVLVLIPLIGTAKTFLFYSGCMFVIGFIGLFTLNNKAALKLSWMPVLLGVLAWLSLSGPIKASAGQIFEAESAYNYIQVIEQDGTRFLLLNEGQGIHSMYHPDLLITKGTWDYFLAAPFFNPAPFDIERVGLVGLAAGTISKQYTRAFGPIPIDGWEIDPAIIAVGQEYFDMNETNLNAIAEDGRWGLANSPHLYSVIGVDAYRLPYIPFHLTTVEFFQEAFEHLSNDGVLVINVGRTLEDRRLIDALAMTILEVFPTVHIVDVPNTFNTIIYATVLPTRSENLMFNLLSLQDMDASDLLVDTLSSAIINLQPVPEDGMIFSDDKAPIEFITNDMVIDFMFQGNIDILR